MEHLGVTLECSSEAGDDDWKIVLVLTGKGGKRACDIANNWLYGAVSTYEDEFLGTPPSQPH